MRSFFVRIPQSITAAVLAAVATAAIIGGYSATLANDDSTTIHGCVAKLDGAVRVVSSDADCDRLGEYPLDWNQKGAQGPQGDPGPQGPAGTVSSLESMNGIPCIVGSLNGTIAVSVGTGGAVAFTCNTQVDNDGDGYPFPSQDCNDSNASVHPGATEVANGIDDDCDGFVDEFGLVLTPSFVSVQPQSGFPFQLSNQGTETATALEFALEGNVLGFFVIDGGTCGTTLGPGATCLIPVSYHPDPGVHDDAELMVWSDGMPISVPAYLDGQ